RSAPTVLPSEANCLDHPTQLDIGEGAFRMTKVSSATCGTPARLLETVPGTQSRGGQEMLWVLSSSPSGERRGAGRALRRGARRGVAAVELAVLSPCLALLFVITVDFARLFYYKLTIDNCARNGAIFGSNLRSYQEKAWVNSYNDITSATTAD